MNSRNLTPLSRVGTVDQIADLLRDKIQTGFYPPGQPLREAALASQLGTSRGPVREALRQLFLEGLLVNFGSKGVAVKDMDEDEIRDVFLARAAIEKAAAASLLQRQDETVFKSLETLIEEMRLAASTGSSSWGSLVGLDISFHQHIVDSLNSPRLSSMYDSLIVESRMAIAKLDSSYPEREDLVSEHQALLDALRGGNLMVLLRQIDAHLDNTARVHKATRKALTGTDANPPE